MDYGHHFNLCETYVTICCCSSHSALTGLPIYLELCFHGVRLRVYVKMAAAVAENNTNANRPAQHLPKINSADDESKTSPCLLICGVCGTRVERGCK